MHFPDHPTGPLPVGDGNASASSSGGVPLVLPRATDLATTSLLKALLAADPAKRPTAPDAFQVEMELMSPLFKYTHTYIYIYSYCSSLFPFVLVPDVC